MLVAVRHCTVSDKCSLTSLPHWLVWMPDFTVLHFAFIAAFCLLLHEFDSV